MRASRRHNAFVVALIALATLGIFGPHLAIVGYKLAGARTPAALVFVCPLHRAGS